jgi:RhtB (resistance to homoserine/threonine) family protein
VATIAIFMAISPGADFVMITRNSMLASRRAGLFSALGVSMAIWIHVTYSIVGLAFIISRSIVVFSIIKYLGAAYLIVLGGKTFLSKTTHSSQTQAVAAEMSAATALKIGFVTNALNPKTTLFFLSIFTQVVQPSTPVWMQVIYGLIISLAHLLWFSIVAFFFSHPALVKRFEAHRKLIERLVGSVLIGFGLKVLFTHHA